MGCKVHNVSGYCAFCARDTLNAENKLLRAENARLRGETDPDYVKTIDENAALKAEVERLRAERDEALEDVGRLRRDKSIEGHRMATMFRKERDEARAALGQQRRALNSNFQAAKRGHPAWHGPVRQEMDRIQKEHAEYIETIKGRHATEVADLYASLGEILTALEPYESDDDFMLGFAVDPYTMIADAKDALARARLAKAEKGGG